MVLNDVSNEFSTFINLFKADANSNPYIKAALSLSDNYNDKLNQLIEIFLKSPKTDTSKTSLSNELQSLEKTFSNQIATMSASVRATTKLISQIEAINFNSSSIKLLSENICNSLNTLIDITEEYSSNKIRNVSNTDTFFKLVSELVNFKELYNQLFSNHSFLKKTENELLEAMPLNNFDNSKIYHLDIRSYKSELNIMSFTDDLQLIAECLQHLERLTYPSENHIIFMRKIESGSLKALFSSDKIDFSIFPDLVTSISNAIRTWRLTPDEKLKLQAETNKLNAETELLKAQTQAQYIQNEGSKMAIVTSQIDYLCEKLSLDSQVPETREQIQQFCLPLITYIEHNPIGTINGIDYDVSKEVQLLECSNIQK